MPAPSQLYTYCCNTPKFKRKDNPEAWTTLDKANAAMFGSYPVFSFIPGTRGEEEPIRYGDFVLDIDSEDLACGSAVSIIDWFYQIYDVNLEQWRIYLSGKKGVHLELPAGIMGLEEGHVLLPLIYKRLGKDIEGELGIQLDLSMYNRGTGKPYRQPNIMREDIGTCKRQIEYLDLGEIGDEEDYRARCGEPGETWEPEDTNYNEILGEKVGHYISEVEKARKELKEKPPLSDDDRDRLTAGIPACMSFLAHVNDFGKTGATFNDIAIQLTSYAVTAGHSEQAFLDGCKDFIENYPSISLDTPRKRYENVKARYRTMTANGYEHSCRAVRSLGFPGFDCANCEQRPQTDRGPQVEVITSDDVDLFDLTLDIPDGVLKPGGLITEGVEALEQPGMPKVPQYILPTILTFIARAVSGKISLGGVWPNLYNIKIGRTSTGKSAADEAVEGKLEEFGLQGFIGANRVASGPAILRFLETSPRTLLIFDEASYLFKRHGFTAAFTDSMLEVLLEIHTKAGSRFQKVYASSKNNINIEFPCLSLLGNTTPLVFNDIKMEDFETGIMQRFDFWGYDGPMLEKGHEINIDTSMLDDFITGIKDLFEFELPGNLQERKGVPEKLSATDEALECINDWSRQVVRECNEEDNEGMRGILSRRYHLGLRYAMIHLSAVRLAEDILAPVEARDIEYGIRVAKMLADWKINKLSQRVTTGDFHRHCELFKGAIKAAIKTKNRPTFKVMANRKTQLKNWDKRYSGSIIEVLEKRGEIILDESGRKTAYYLPKEDN